MGIADIDIGDVRGFVEDGGARNKGADFYTVPEGRQEIEIDGEPGKPVIRRFDFIPYMVTDQNHPSSKAKVGSLWWERTLRVHREAGPDKWNGVCPRSHGKKCFGCEEMFSLRDDGYEKNEKEIKDLSPQELLMHNVVDADNPDAGVQLLVLSKGKFFNKLKEVLEAHNDDRLFRFASLKQGLTLKITFGQRKYNGRSFWEAKLIEFEERDEQYDESILEEAINLDEIIGDSPSYEETKAIFLGSDLAPERDTEEREVPERDESDDEPTTRRNRYSKKEADEDADKLPHMGPEKNDKPKVARRKSEPESEPETEPETECPHGHPFGTPDDHDECNKCPEELWDKCMAAKVAARKANRK